MANSVQAERLRAVEVLLREPYFAKIALQFKEGASGQGALHRLGGHFGRERTGAWSWIGAAPWPRCTTTRTMGPTSYVADGRTIHVDLQAAPPVRNRGGPPHHLLRLGRGHRGQAAARVAFHAGARRRCRPSRPPSSASRTPVVRHEDVPVLQVSGHRRLAARPRCCMQRIAYLFYQHRGSLDPSSGLPHLAEPGVPAATSTACCPTSASAIRRSSPGRSSLAPLLPAGRGVGESDVSLERLRAIDAAVASFEFARSDFRDITSGRRAPARRGCGRRRCRRSSPNLPAGPHRVDAHGARSCHARLTARLKSAGRRWRIRMMRSPRFPWTSSCACSDEVFDPPERRGGPHAGASCICEEKHADALRAMDADGVAVTSTASAVRLLGTRGADLGGVGLPEDGAHRSWQPRGAATS